MEKRRFFPFIALLLCCTASALFPDSDDFGFKPLRRKLRYVEEFYALYTENHMASTDSIEQNLFFLQYALNSEYIHPIQALAVIRTEEEHAQYKRFLRGRIAFLLAKGFVQLGWRYDKENVFFFNKEFADELRKGFRIAEYYYKEAAAYWKETLRVYEEALANPDVRVRGALLDAIFDEARRIDSGEIDYGRVIDRRLADLERKLRLLDE